MNLLQSRTEQDSYCESIAPDITYLTTMIVNVCFIGPKGAKDGEWALIDTGMDTSGDAIIEKAKDMFGNSRPSAIILTHGHFDHVGSVNMLSEHYDVPVYAHELELPYLTGKADYPPPDPSVGGGMMAVISPLYPNEAINLENRVKALPKDGSIPSLSNWRYIHTPGHTPGHISLFRDSDRVLIAGDAFTTVKQESAMAVLFQKKEIHGPPAYFTSDWDKAKESVQKLEALHPLFVISGHGKPMCGEELRKQLSDLSADFDEEAVPDRGKYVNK